MAHELYFYVLVEVLTCLYKGLGLTGCPIDGMDKHRRGMLEILGSVSKEMPTELLIIFTAVTANTGNYACAACDEKANILTPSCVPPSIFAVTLDYFSLVDSTGDLTLNFSYSMHVIDKIMTQGSSTRTWPVFSSRSL